MEKPVFFLLFTFRLWHVRRSQKLFNIYKIEWIRWIRIDERRRMLCKLQTVCRRRRKKNRLQWIMTMSLGCNVLWLSVEQKKKIESRVVKRLRSSNVLCVQTLDKYIIAERTKTYLPISTAMEQCKIDNKLVVFGISLLCGRLFDNKMAIRHSVEIWRFLWMCLLCLLVHKLSNNESTHPIHIFFSFSSPQITQIIPFINTNTAMKIRLIFVMGFRFLEFFFVLFAVEIFFNGNAETGWFNFNKMTLNINFLREKFVIIIIE